MYILTWKRASRHSGVQLFISHLTTWLRSRRISVFDPPEPQIIGQTQCFATFLPFRAPGSSFFGDFLFFIFFLLLFSSLTLPLAAFHLSTHIVGSLTSKLPSMIHRVQHFEVLLDFGLFQFRVISIPGWGTN